MISYPSEEQINNMTVIQIRALIKENFPSFHSNIYNRDELRADFNKKCRNAEEVLRTGKL
jgi:hypothetical protein